MNADLTPNDASSIDSLREENRGLRDQLLATRKELVRLRAWQSEIGKALLFGSGDPVPPPPPAAPASAPAPHACDVPRANLPEFLDELERGGSTNIYPEFVAMTERYLLTRVLRDVEGNQSKAAEKLGITRGSLRNKIRALGIRIGMSVEDNDLEDA